MTADERRDALCARASELIAHGDLEGAVEAAKAAVAIDAKTGIAHATLAAALDASGEPNLAMHAIDVGANLDQGRAGVYFTGVAESVKAKFRLLRGLHDAAAAGDLAAVARFTKVVDSMGYPRMKCIPIGDKKEQETTVVCNAAFAGHAHVLKWLSSDGGYEMNFEDDDGRSPLHLLLLHVKRPVNWQKCATTLSEDCSLALLLHRAIHLGDLEVAKWLHDRDSSLLTSVNDEGRTPLHIACLVPCFREGHLKQHLISFLLLKGGLDLLLHKDAHSKPALTYLTKEPADARIRKWVAAWIRLARNMSMLPPPPPFDEEMKNLPCGAFRATLPPSCSSEKQQQQLRPPCQAASFADQYARFDKITIQDDGDNVTV